MLIRIISSVVLFPILFFFVFVGGLPLKIGIVLISLIGMYEFYKAICKKIMPIHFLAFIVSSIYILTLGTPMFKVIDLIFGIFLLINMIFMVFYYKNTNIYDLALNVFGICYIPVTFSTIYLIKGFHYGQFSVWLPFVCAWACDTGAYFVGVLFGKHKLTQGLSPKKTIEGSMGGILFSAIACALYGLFISNYETETAHLFNNKISLIVSFTILGIIGSIFAQFGDLTASAIKRKFNIKDYGNLIPGHGGILDRFDSVIFTSSICYIILRIIDNYYVMY